MAKIGCNPVQIVTSVVIINYLCSCYRPRSCIQLCDRSDSIASNHAYENAQPDRTIIIGLHPGNAEVQVKHHKPAHNKRQRPLMCVIIHTDSEKYEWLDGDEVTSCYGWPTQIAHRIRHCSLGRHAPVPVQ